MKPLRQPWIPLAAVFTALTLCLSFATSTSARGAADSEANAGPGEAATAPKNASVVANENADEKAGAAIRAALCQVVYPLDATPENGYRYMFFGNGFFINDQGYVVTAAHLLGYFRNGGIPYILVGPESGPRQMVEAPIVAADWDHDVAVLKPDTNPLQADKSIGYLRISTATPAKGNGVISASLRPPDTENAHSSLAPLEDFSSSRVLDYLFFRDKGEQSELLLFNQDVVPGQSGSPLVSAETNEVVGIVVGKWLHPTVIPSGANGGHTTMAPGAALRIHYAISLLDQLHVKWNSTNAAAQVAATEGTRAAIQPVAQVVAQPVATVPAKVPTAAAPAQQQGQASQQGYVPPAPLSVVGVAYPPQALFGGNVLLDASVDADGKLSDVRVVNGDEPFLNVVLDAIRTWSFSPATTGGRAVQGRIGIAFQFPQSYVPAVVSRERTYPEPLADAVSRGPLPIYTIEPIYPINSIAEGSVILYGVVDPQGQVTSTTAIRGIDSLSIPTEQAVAQWKWVPGKEAGTSAESAVLVVVTYRRPTM